VKFDISNNRLSAEGGKALAGALKGNQVMTELNIAKNRLGFKAEGYEKADMSGVVAISDAIPTMGALAKFTFSGDHEYSEPVAIESSMTEADFRYKYLQASGAIMLAAFLPKCRYVQEYPSVRPLIYFLPSGR
jgi:hypothetical protein